MRTPTSVAPNRLGEASPVFSNSDHIQDAESFHHPYGYYAQEEENFTADETSWADDDGSESETSNSYAGPPSEPRTYPARLPVRSQPLPRQSQYRSARHAPNPEPSVEQPDEFGGGYPQGYPSGLYGRNGFHRGVAPQHQQQYGSYYSPQGQMVAYPNPFTPLNSPPSNGGYYQDGRGYGTEMIHPGQYFHPHNYAQYLGHPPAPAPAAGSSEPTEREKALAAKISEFEKEKQEKEQAERQKLFEAEAQRKAAEDSKRIMEEMERLKEQNKIEIARAKSEATRTARENIEAERKAAEDRLKEQQEAIKQAEERMKIQFDNQIRAAEAQRKKEEEERAQAEEAAKLRLAAALRAEEERKAAEAKKAAEDAAKVKQIQEDAARKANLEMIAKIEAEKEAAKQKAEAEAIAKAEKDAFKKKVEEETKAALEEKAKKDRGPFLQFKDALGRKYSFPYRLCTTWPNMEELIKQAFDNINDLTHNVQEGWYDLHGPNGEIILPSVWERVIEPEWSITMTMWPMDRIRSRFAEMPPGMAAMGRGHGMPPVPPPAGRGRPVSGIPPVVQSEKKAKKKHPPAFTAFFGVKPPKKKSSKK